MRGHRARPEPTGLLSSPATVHFSTPVPTHSALALLSITPVPVTFLWTPPLSQRMDTPRQPTACQAELPI